jgi:hypothetical protein
LDADVTETIIINGEMDGEYRHLFVFMSDRDKGLKPALCEAFPRNLAVRYAKHIQANVKAKFGQLCARYVIQIAKAFSTRRSDDLIDKIRNIKVAATEYIENVDDRATKPPIFRGQQAGRPPVKRVCHHSECIRPEDSNIKCGKCG